MRYIHILLAAASLAGQPARAGACPPVVVDLVSVSGSDITVISLQNARCDLLIAPAEAGARLVAVQLPRIGTIEQTSDGLLYRRNSDWSVGDSFLISPQSSPHDRAIVLVRLAQ
jgi:hypothetical protein